MSGDLLDTSVLIAESAAIGDPPRSAAISVITLGELHAGLLLARGDDARSARKRRLDAVGTAFLPLPVDLPVAEWYGRVLASARAERRTAKATDLLIVATAAAHGRTLHTLDDRQAALARAAGIPVRELV